MENDGRGTWEPEIEELRRREVMAVRMGGAEKVERQHAGGKLTVRERIDALLDPGSFHEIGALAGRATYEDGVLTDFTPANFVMGRGRIDGRPVVVGGDDFTVRGGAADASIFQKQVHAEQMAHELRLPIVRLVDGTGGGGSVKIARRPSGARTSRPTRAGSGSSTTWPRCRSSRWPSARWPASARPGSSTSHYSLMVRGTSQVFVAGPPVVARLGENVDKEELGGSHIHGATARSTTWSATEDEAFERTRRFLSYLPSSRRRRCPPRAEPDDDPERREEWLIDAIPRDRRKVYKVRPIIEAVVDHGSFFEIGAGWGRSAVTGLARLDGWPVAVLASDPYLYGGGWTADASQKVDALRRPGRDVPPARSCTSSTSPASSSAPRPSGPARSATAPGRWPRSTRRPCRGAR